MIRVGIIGGAGYTAGELIRLLVHHPEATLTYVYSTSNAGNSIGTVHQDLAMLDMTFTDTISDEVDVVFFCLGHGHSAMFLKEYTFSSKTKIIDLSNEFRLKGTAFFEGRDFVYGLPELNKATIQNAQNIANPGCFATAIQLALLPLAAQGFLIDDIHVHGITGATGAGRSPSETTHFAWRNTNVSHYKAFNHQHLDEIYQSIKQLQSGFDKEVYFLPHRGNFSKGIFTTIYTHYEGTIEDAIALYKSYYKDAVFTKVVSQPLHLKQVINTNFCFLHLEKHGNKLLITSVVDNLIKGASGQAIENMNLLFGIGQNAGLTLKANYF